MSFKNELKNGSSLDVYGTGTNAEFKTLYLIRKLKPFVQVVGGGVIVFALGGAVASLITV